MARLARLDNPGVLNHIDCVSYLLMDVGAADKAAIQLVKVQPYQLLVSDT